MNGTKVIFDCPLPAWLVGALCLAVLAVVTVLVARDVGHLGKLRRRLILAAAIVATLMLAGLALSPKVIRTWEDPQKPVCLVLADGSRSMLFKDTYEGEQAAWLAEKMNQGSTAGVLETTRAKVVQTLLAQGQGGWLDGLGQDFDVRCRRFSWGSEPLAVGADGLGYKVDAEGYATAIGLALEDSSAEVGSELLQAVVLISDGAWNCGPDPSQVSRVLGRLGVGVYAVGIGTEEQPREVAVLSLKVPQSVLLGDKLYIKAQIAGTGMGSGRVPVRLESDGVLIEEKEVSTLVGGQPVGVSFSFVPSSPGRRLLRVRIPAQENEQDETNNSASGWVQVEERKIKVLLVETEPRWEFRFIRNVLERDPAVSVRVCLLRPGVGPIAGEGYLRQLPRDKKELGKYDLVMLGDVGRAELGEEFLKELAQMVRRQGVALIVLAGRGDHYRELAGTELSNILPVSLGTGMESLGGLGRPFHLELTQEGSWHLMTRLAESEDENELRWTQLPRAHWSASVGGLARGASALLVHPYRIAGSTKLPLLAVQRVGRGKVMFCGIDETWRWRKSVGDQYHYRFWAQAVRWMAKKRFGQGDKRSLLSIDRNQSDVGEKVQIEAYCLDMDGFPLEGAQVQARIEGAQGRVKHLALHAVAGGWGIYQGDFRPSKAGKYKIRPIVSLYGQEPLDSMVELEVSRVDLEKNFWSQDRHSLEALAQAGGGEYLEMSEVDRLVSLLGANKRQRLVTAEYSLCEHWLYYVVLAAVLASGWLIRKRSGLP